jgi:hypothetical protein
MNKFISMTLAAAMVAASVSAASSATIQVVAGKVAHNGGTGFKAVNASKAAKQGDKVMTSAASEADIVYEDGCREHVRANRVVHVRTAAICQSETANAGTHLPPEIPPVAVAAAVGAGAGLIYLIASKGPKCVSAC